MYQEVWLVIYRGLQHRAATFPPRNVPDLKLPSLQEQILAEDVIQWFPRKPHIINTEFLQ